MTVKDLRVFLFENYHKRLCFTIEDSYYLLKKQIKKPNKDLVLLASKLMKRI